MDDDVEVLVEALRFRLDWLKMELRTSGTYYLKSDPRSAPRRSRMARQLLAVRRLLRGAGPVRWPLWYAEEPTVAWHLEGR